MSPTAVSSPTRPKLKPAICCDGASRPPLSPRQNPKSGSNSQHNPSGMPQSTKATVTCRPRRGPEKPVPGTTDCVVKK